MENLEKLNVIELSEAELAQIDGGRFWKLVDFFFKALEIQDSINSFVDGWNSVECGCPAKK